MAVASSSVCSSAMPYGEFPKYRPTVACVNIYLAAHSAFFKLGCARRLGLPSLGNRDHTRNRRRCGTHTNPNPWSTLDRRFTNH